MVRAIDVAREAGRKVAFTLSDTFCVDRHRDGFARLIDDGRIDILFANEAEILAMGGVSHLETAIGSVKDKVETLVVTRSEHGALATQRGERAQVAAEPITELVDTTGAGDLFAAGFLTGQARHLTLERWQVPGGFKTTHVPFSGWGEMSPALLGGHIDAAMAQPGEVKPLVDAKKLRVLAVASPQRHPFFPDAPTGKELGLGDGIGTWFVLTAPKGTPGPALKALHDSAKAALEEPTFVALMKSRGVEIDYKSGDKLRQELVREQKEWTDVLKRLGMIKK